MGLTVDDITRIAKLARIRVQEADKQALAKDLSGILTWIDQLQQVNTDSVKNYSDEYALTLPNRPDEVSDGAYPDKVLRNGPEVAHGLFVVPKVVE